MWLVILINKMTPMGILSEYGLWEGDQVNPCISRVFKSYFNKCVGGKLPVEPQTQMVFFVAYPIDLLEQIR